MPSCSPAAVFLLAASLLLPQAASAAELTLSGRVLSTESVSGATLPKLLQKGAVIQHTGSPAPVQVLVGVCGPSSVQVEVGRMTLEAGKQTISSSLLAASALEGSWEPGSPLVPEGLSGVRDPQAWLEKNASRLREQAGASAKDAVVVLLVVPEDGAASGRLFLLRKLPGR